MNDPRFDKKTHDPKQVSWSRDLTKRLKQSKPIFDKNKIKIALYRPFFKQFLYLDNTLIERTAGMSRFFPDNKSENIIICVSYKGIGTRFSAIVTNVLPDLHILEQNQCFPLYTYDIKKNTKKEKKDNITGATLKEYQIFYNDKKKLCFKDKWGGNNNFLRE